MGLVADAQRTRGRRLFHASRDVHRGSANAGFGINTAAEQDAPRVQPDANVEALVRVTPTHELRRVPTLRQQGEPGSDCAFGVVFSG